MRRLLCLLSLVGLGLSLLVTAPAARADGADDAAFLAAANAERSRAGVQQLRMSSDLVAVAAKQAQAMASEGRIYHNPNLGSDVRNWRTVAENVGRGADVGQIQGAFMGSSGHRANILNGVFSEAGIATVRAGDYLYVAEVFREPASAAAAPAPAPARPAPAPAPAPAPRPVAAPKPAPAPAPVAVAPAPAPQPTIPTAEQLAQAAAATQSTPGGPVVEPVQALQTEQIVDLEPAGGSRPDKTRIALLAMWLLIGVGSLHVRRLGLVVPRLVVRTA